ncbi:ribosome maturation factor RimM [Nitrosomonas ureae]|nr:ribosome maturation factor RimM [Nitrosomonas ureae]
MIVMGHIIGPYGVHGWIKINPYTEHLDGLMEYSQWWLGDENTEWHKVHVVNGHIYGTTLLVKLKEYSDRTQATKLKGIQIAIPRNWLPDLSENGVDGYYWTDLINAKVLNLKGEKLGTVVGLFATGANDVLRIIRIDQEKKEILIPCISQYVVKIDLENAQIIVDWDWDY